MDIITITVLVVAVLALAGWGYGYYAVPAAAPGAVGQPSFRDRSRHHRATRQQGARRIATLGPGRSLVRRGLRSGLACRTTP